MTRPAHVPPRPARHKTATIAGVHSRNHHPVPAAALTACQAPLAAATGRTGIAGRLQMPAAAPATVPQLASVISRLAAAALAAAMMASCTGSTHAAPARAASAERSLPAGPGSHATSASVKAQALSAYLGMWHAYMAASRTADYQSPSLAHYAAGGALSVLMHGLYKNFRNGVVTRGNPVFHPKVKVSTSNGQPFQATVTDCADTSHWADYYKSGKPAPDGRRGRHRIFAELQPFDGVWKVTLLVVEKEGTC
jgi:hypothetical protein